MAERQWFYIPVFYHQFLGAKPTGGLHPSADHRGSGQCYGNTRRKKLSLPREGRPPQPPVSGQTVDGIVVLLVAVGGSAGRTRDPNAPTVNIRYRDFTRGGLKVVAATWNSLTRPPLSRLKLLSRELPVTRLSGTCLVAWQLPDLFLSVSSALREPFDAVGSRLP